MIRLPLLAALRDSSPELFEGCQPNSSSEVLTHYVTSFRDYHALRGWSSCCLFLDLSSAYYRVIRAKITEEEWTDASICHVLSQMGVSPALFDSIRTWLRGGTVTTSMGQHHRDVLRAAFRSSGFLLRNVQCIYRTRSGTRPGDSIADTLFALVLAEATQDLRSRLGDAGFLRDALGTAPAFPVWADDSVLPFAFCTADSTSGSQSIVMLFGKKSGWLAQHKPPTSGNLPGSSTVRVSWASGPLRPCSPCKGGGIVIFAALPEAATVPWGRTCTRLTSTNVMLGFLPLGRPAVSVLSSFGRKTGW